MIVYLALDYRPARLDILRDYPLQFGIYAKSTGYANGIFRRLCGVNCVDKGNKEFSCDWYICRCAVGVDVLDAPLAVEITPIDSSVQACNLFNQTVGEDIIFPLALAPIGVAIFRKICYDTITE